jgi:hypothetical protein
VLLAGALAGCGGSTPKTVAATGPAVSAAARIDADRACVRHFNASGQLVPFETLHTALTGGYVTTGATVGGMRARCALLLFLRLIPHRRAVPMLFFTRSSAGPWRHALPMDRALEIGPRARIPGGIRLDVEDPFRLTLAR